MRFIILIIVIINLSSCFNRVSNHGFMFDSSDFDTIKKGVSNKRDVLNNLGAPSIRQDNIDNSWIYFSQDIEKFLFFKPKVVNRKIILIDFDKSDTINNIKYFKLSDGRDFTFYNKYTSVKGHKQPGLIGDLFGNIGKVTPQ